MAIDESGNLWAWGENRYGQLGDGSKENRSSPVQIKASTKFKEVGVYGSHTMAIDESGNLWAWGDNSYGQLGDGTKEDRSTPVQINAGTKFKVVKAFRNDTFAIDERGNLWNSDANLQLTLIKNEAGTKFKTIDHD